MSNSPFVTKFRGCHLDVVPFETPTPEPTQHRDFFWSTCIPPKVEEDQKLYQ